MANDITILSCPICYNPKLREYGNGIYQCDVCETYFDKNENIVLTEQNWLQTCNTEQLAEAITDIVYECRERDDCMDCRLGWCSKDCVVEWLKQPHTTEG